MISATTVEAEDTGKVSHRSGACIGRKVNDVIVPCGPELSCVIKHCPVDIPRREKSVAHNARDYLPTCEETECYGRRVDREKGVGEGPSFPVLCSPLHLQWCHC